MIATAGDGFAILGLAALALLGCTAPPLWAHWTVRGKPWAWRLAALPTVGIVVATVAGGEPAWLLLVAAVVAAAVHARRRFQHRGRVATAVLIVAAGLPLYALTLFGVLVGIAAFSCAPDAYECPL
jgi:hypothetical protein